MRYGRNDERRMGGGGTLRAIQDKDTGSPWLVMIELHLPSDDIARDLLVNCASCSKSCELDGGDRTHASPLDKSGASCTSKSVTGFLCQRKGTNDLDRDDAYILGCV